MLLHPDLTLIDGRFEPDVRVRIDDAGRIAEVGANVAGPTLRLAGQALVPGMVNAHSHAFQRGLRGRAETFPVDDADFWTWREAMYALADSVDEQRLYALCRQAFAEMLSAGITTVGEFHYLRHEGAARPYAFDDAILRAASDAGIRLVLLSVHYATGSIGAPLQGAQRRFATSSLEEHWAQLDRLAARLDPRTQSLGVAAHSIRAVAREEIARLYEGALRRGLPFHMHVEEQPREIEDCLHAYGKTPTALLRDLLELGPSFTAVHCTHTAEADLDDLINSGAGVCLCPLTEANLGDGFPNLPRMVRGGATISLGSDSNARISFLEEMRWLELAHRLAGQRRGICRDPDGRVASLLWGAATVNGARSLGLRAGRIRPGDAADLLAIDLAAPALAGWEPRTLLESIILGAGDEVIAGVCVGGQWRRSPAGGCGA